MWVRITTGFRGRETNEIYWPPDSIQDVDDALAAQLIGNGQAIAINMGIDWMDQAVSTEASADTAPPASINKIITPSEIDVDRDTEDATANSLAQLEAAAALLEGRTPGVPLGEGLPLTDDERALLEATGHPVVKPDPKPKSGKRK